MLSKIEQQHISVDVNFYNKDEMEKLLHFPASDKIIEIVKAPIEVRVSEFLTYYLFHKKMPDKSGWRNYGEISSRVDRAFSELEDFVVFNGHSISTAPDVDDQVKSITEDIGESIGLSVVNRIQGLTQADWGKIPEKKGKGAPKVFDYQFDQAASDGKSTIQIETKGSAIKENLKKEGAIYTHKSNISEKKTYIRKHLSKNTYPFPSDVMYGTITVMGQRVDSIVKCWLVDPEPEMIKVDPKILRLINRMNFLYGWISFLSPRSQLASALATRLATLKTLENPFELDRIQLKKGNGEDFDFETFDQYGNHSSWMAAKSKVTDGPAGGMIIQLSKNALFFLGIRERLLTLSAEQKFDDIIKYKSDSRTMMKTIECVLSKGRYKTFYLPDYISDDARESGGYYRFFMEGQVHYSPEGIVFGILPFGEKRGRG